MPIDFTFLPQAVNQLPTTPISWVLLTREYKDNSILVELPDGDSYEVTSEQFVLFLRNQKFPEPEKCLDYLWNFHTVFCDIARERYFWLSEEDLELIGAKLREQ